MAALPPPPDLNDDVPQRLILASAEPDAVCAGLMIAARPGLPVRRIHAPEFGMAEALSRPVVRRATRGELWIVGLAPDARAIQAFLDQLEDLPGLTVRVIDHHLWEPELLAAMRGQGVEYEKHSDTWRTTESLPHQNGENPSIRRIAGLAHGEEEDRQWAEHWRKTLLGYWSDSASLNRVTEPLLEDSPASPEPDDLAVGIALERELDELSEATYHRFPVGAEEGILVIHPGHAVAPVREFSARLRRKRDVAFSLSCFDDGAYGLLEFGRAPFGRKPDGGALIDPAAVLRRCVFADPLTARAIDRGAVLIESRRGALPPYLASILESLS